ncbi:hypothetical protein T484DRAFT_1890753, partial [Baffinella frigidus]
MNERKALIVSGVAAALALCAVALIASSNNAARVETLAIRHHKAGPAAVASKVQRVNAKLASVYKVRNAEFKSNARTAGFGFVAAKKAAKGAAKHAPKAMKARVQSLDDEMGEFDPINDYDSNYGRVLGVQEPSRTNGFVPEDMDVSPERKAPVQMLAEKAPARTMLAEKAPARTVWQQIGAQDPHAAANNVMKQNDDTGYKARKVQLSQVQAQSVWQQIGAQDPHAAANKVMKQNDDTGYKARKVQLSQVQAQSVWQQIGAQEPHAAANKVMKQNDDTGYKARKVQLAQEQAQSVWQQIGAQEPHAAANKVMKQNDDTGYKARTQSLDDEM